MVQRKLEEILREVADIQNLTDYEIYLDTNPLRGDGFLSECYTGEIINKETWEKIQIYIKMCTSALDELVPQGCSTECHFYSKIFPELNKFQVEKGVKILFQNIPKFYCGKDETVKKYVAMENLKSQDYCLVDKKLSMKEDHLKLVFSTYGKFHALSFTYKDQNFDNYLELTKPLVVNFNNSIFKEAQFNFIQAYNAVKKIDTNISKKIEPIIENLKEVYVDCMIYKGKYSGICHGDCWSNNFLFKYNENGQIEDMKLIDFQLAREGTPIFDLSYFFYSGAAKEDFDKLDNYLEFYHKSFSDFAKELGSDPEKLLPLNELKAEWKKYSLFGIFSGIMLWNGKLIPKDTIEAFIRTNDEAVFNEVVPKILESDFFKKKISDILIHAVKYGII